MTSTPSALAGDHRHAVAVCLREAIGRHCAHEVSAGAKPGWGWDLPILELYVEPRRPNHVRILTAEDEFGEAFVEWVDEWGWSR